MTSTPLDNVPQLIHHTTLHNPTISTRTWSSQPHLSPQTPLLATAASDKSIHIWDMRDWKLLSTIAGGHKRSIRCVGWKDYGSQRQKKRKAIHQVSNDADESEPRKGAQEDPVILATGSFDANCGLWVWNRNQRGDTDQRDSLSRPGNVPGSFAEDGEHEQDFTNEQSEENEEWHFSTLLTGPDSEIKDLEFSPAHYGANLLATCSRDKSVWVWEEVEPEEWETVAVLSEHTGDVKCVSWLAGARTSRAELKRRLSKRHEAIEETTVPMQVDGQGSNGDTGHEHEDEEIILGGRELLASGSYDDTIRLHHDDEAEGDWLCIAVMTGHDGTVWDLKFESRVNLTSYPPETTEEEVIAEWAPRLLSCSDDKTVRLWKKGLSEKERDERRLRISEARQGQSAAQNGNTSSGAVIQTGFASSRLPSVIRPPTSTEQWVEEARLPAVHVRSVYAIDWSVRTGLVVSCGGDGLIAVYQEVTTTPSTAHSNEDVTMNGADEQETQTNNDTTPNTELEGEIQKLKTEWKVVAYIEAAHDEYEINHVCWAPKRDMKRNELDRGVVNVDEQTEEYIVSTGDDGEVRIWRLPREVLDTIERER